MRLTLILLLLMLFAAPLTAQDTCALPPRLLPGTLARVVIGGLPNNLRAAPTTDSRQLGQILPGAVFSVTGAAQCAEGYRWWPVAHQGVAGWTAEGDSETYWLEPLVVNAPDDAAGCLEPPDDYTRVQVGAADFNARTLAMLDHAGALYQQLGGTAVDFRRAITQGGYNGGYVAASFGTHDGGGAVDLSVRSREDLRILYDDIPLMLRALRVAGFAAWLRDADELYPGSPIHIHAIAIGDRELSQAARDQIDGPYGYLRGYNGLPQADEVPRPDTSGELVICDWMIAAGFDDLRPDVPTGD